jgi:hypothetical protein
VYFLPFSFYFPFFERLIHLLFFLSSPVSCSFVLLALSQVLQVSCLLEVNYIKDAVNKINDLNMISRRTMFPDGNPYWRATQGRAIATAEHVYAMYSSLNTRYSSHKKALKREQIKNIAPVSDKFKGKSKTDKVRVYILSVIRCYLFLLGMVDISLFLASFLLCRQEDQGFTLHLLRLRKEKVLFVHLQGLQ